MVHLKMVHLKMESFDSLEWIELVELFGLAGKMN